ncbi:GNAT family N-acetyltransferase [Streptomyces sp. NPDC050149]|uniref:GNAT family N-acetyltransferase n=1 Tax=Streptomyces sp. NPDC050149 TaxID=3365603 RepID=UPI00379C4883
MRRGGAIEAGGLLPGVTGGGGMIGLISLRRRTPSMGTLSYILREDTWGHGYATHAAHQVLSVVFTTVGLNRLKRPCTTPTTPPPAAS